MLALRFVQTLAVSGRHVNNAALFIRTTQAMMKLSNVDPNDISCTNVHPEHSNIRWGYDCNLGIVRVTDNVRNVCVEIGQHAANIGTGVGYAIDQLGNEAA